MLKKIRWLSQLFRIFVLYIDVDYLHSFVGTVYLDHAGATLYSESQMEAIFKDLNTTVYGNPRKLFFQLSTGGSLI